MTVGVRVGIDVSVGVAVRVGEGEGVGVSVDGGVAVRVGATGVEAATLAGWTSGAQPGRASKAKMNRQIN